MYLDILGIDLSLTGTGMCFIEEAGGDTAIETTTVESKPSGDDLESRAARVVDLTRRITESAWLTPGGGGFWPTLAAIEAPAFSRGAQPGQHIRAGLWWAVVCRLRSFGILVVEVSPSARAKYATGKGNAGKDAVLAAVIRRYDGVCLVGGNDEADALILAAMGARHLGHPIERDPLPAANLAAMDSVRWPA